MAQPIHIIWGRVENTYGPNEDSGSTFHGDPNSESAQGHSSSSGQRGAVSQLPSEIQSYLEGVTFNEETSGSNSQSHASSTPSANHGRGSHSSMDGMPNARREASRLKNKANSGLALAAEAAMDRAVSEQGLGSGMDQVEGQSVADGEQGGPGAFVASLNDKDQEDIAAVMMQVDNGMTPGFAEFWSKGSFQHRAGTCRPCHYVHTSAGCTNGGECEFCHLPHTKRSRPRPCKTKRMQCKRFVSLLQEVHDRDPVKFYEAMQVVAMHSPYLQGILRKKLEADAEAVAAVSGAAASQPAVARKKNILSL